MDHDVSSPTGEGRFSNVKIYESGTDTTPNPPHITSTPVTTATVGVSYSYDADGRVEATGDSPITFSLGNGPSGMSVSGDGRVSWTPVAGQEGTHSVEIVATNPGGSDTQSFEITVASQPPVGGNDTINFNEHVLSSYGSQDQGGVVRVEDGGATLYLQGNRWQKIDLPYTVTANTVLEFDFSSGSEGEVHGIGLDADNSLSSTQIFKVHGTQNWGIRDYDNYVGGVKHYVIPVGQYYTGSMAYLFFVMDHDVSSPTGEGRFSNVRVYEQ
jgi:hypothetical protein